jgi:hypothetical protein
MSVDALNQIIGEAIINKKFRDALLTNPSAAVAGFDLGLEELDLITTIRAQSLDHLARQLIAGLGLEGETGLEPVFGRNGHGPNYHARRNGHGPANGEIARDKPRSPGLAQEPVQAGIPGR